MKRYQRVGQSYFPVDWQSAFRLARSSVGRLWVLLAIAGAIAISAIVVGSIALNETRTPTDRLVQPGNELTEPGEIPSSHNEHIINCNASQCDMTLPLDETYVGMTMRVCAVDNSNSTITLPDGLFWDKNDAFPVVQFQTDDMPCCIEFRVVAVDKVDVLSYSCALFCTDTTGIHCIDPKNPGETNAWHGWWRTTTQTYAVYPFNDILFIDATVSPMVLKTPFQFSSVSNPTKSFDFIGALFFVPGEPTRQIEGVESADPDNTDIFQPSYFLQPDGTIFVRRTSTIDSVPIRGNVGLLSRYDGQYDFSDTSFLGLILPDSTVDTDNPVVVFTVITETMRRNEYKKTDAAVASGSGIGVYAMKALADSLLAGDVTYTVPVHEIYNTQDANGVTIVRTTEYHHCNPASVVSFSGFTGAYSAMNSLLYDVNPIRVTQHKFAAVGGAHLDYSADPNARTAHHDVSIEFDSSGLPFNATTGKADFTGTPMMTVTIKQVTAASEYIEMLNAIFHVMYESSEIQTHPWGFAVHNPANPALQGTNPVWDLARTWAEASNFPVATHIAANNGDNQATAFYGAFNLKFRNLLQSVYGAPGGCIDPGCTLITNQYIINSRFAGLNSQSQEIGNFAALYNYDIPLENYVTGAKAPFYRSAGPPNFDTETGFLNTLGYGPLTSGSTLEGAIFDLGVFPTPGESWSIPFDLMPPNVDSPIVPWWPVPPTTNDPYSEFFTADQLKAFSLNYCGIINQTFTGGKKIGYIRFNVAVLDPFLIGASGLTAPDPQGNRADNYQALQAVTAEMMRYLVTTEDVDDIIIDTRGGFYSSNVAQEILRSFFGTTEFENEIPGRITKGGADGQTFGVAASSQQGYVEESRLMLPAVTEAVFPGSVFTGGKVAVLVDDSPFSYDPGAFFKNSTGGSDLGGGTESIIVGATKNINGDGSLFTGIQIPSARTGNSISGATYVNPAYNPTEVLRSDGSDFRYRTPSDVQDPLSGYQGLAGGAALPMDLETLLYPDLGLTTNSRPRLAGDARPMQPNPADRSEFRDTWLEATIEELLLSKKRTPKKRHRFAAKKVSQKKTATSRLQKCTVPQEQLTMIAQANFNHEIMYPNQLNATAQARHSAMQEFNKMVSTQIKLGNICRDDNNAVCVTPSVGELPKFKLAMPVTLASKK